MQKRALTFEVTIPDSVLEWLVVTNSADDILWQDWCDYYPLGMESAEQLAGDMRADLECFLAALVGGEFRIN